MASSLTDEQRTIVLRLAAFAVDGHVAVVVRVEGDGPAGETLAGDRVDLNEEEVIVGSNIWSLDNVAPLGAEVIGLDLHVLGDLEGRDVGDVVSCRCHAHDIGVVRASSTHRGSLGEEFDDHAYWRSTLGQHDMQQQAFSGGGEANILVLENLLPDKLSFVDAAVVEYFHLLEAFRRGNRVW